MDKLFKEGESYSTVRGEVWICARYEGNLVFFEPQGEKPTDWALNSEGHIVFQVKTANLLLGSGFVKHNPKPKN